MTIGEQISVIQTILKNNHQSTRYPDALIYTMIKDARAYLLKQNADSNKNISKTNWQTICVPLIKSKNDCECFEGDCEYLQSDIIAGVISKYGKPFIKVATFDGDEIPYVSPTIADKVKYYKHLSNKTVYSLINNKIRIYNNFLLKCVVVHAVFEDPLEIDGLLNVDSNGNETSDCAFDKNTSSYPLDASLAAAVRDIIYKELIPSYKLTQDAGNEGRDIRSKDEV